MQAIMTRIATGLAAAAAAVAARRAAEFGWRLTRGQDPPNSDDDARLRDLMLWSAVVTIAVLLARKFAASKTEELLTDEA